MAAYDVEDIVVVKLKEWSGLARVDVEKVTDRLFQIENIKPTDDGTLFGEPVYFGQFLPSVEHEDPIAGILNHGQISHKETKAYLEKMEKSSS